MEVINMSEILFQFHITTCVLSETQKIRYQEICKQYAVKPVFIILPKGQYIQQPMFTALIYGKYFDEAYQKSQYITDAFEKAGFPAKRVKAEVFAENADLASIPDDSCFKPYFEWHCKVEADNLDLIKNLSRKFEGHVSENTLETGTKFITIREYGCKELFYSKASQLSQALKQNNIPIIKEKFEYCIYDSRLELDQGWAY